MPIKWLLFIVLSIIWGSSFILMKYGLENLGAWQVASLRIICAAWVLIPFALRATRQIPKNKWGLVFLSGLLGSFIPAYLFCIAEQEIDSSVAGILNALTPIFVILSGVLFFHQKVPFNKILGIAVAFTGCILLFLFHAAPAKESGFIHAFLILLATICYGINVNLVHKYLHSISSILIVSLSMLMNSIAATILLISDGFLNHSFTGKAIWGSLLAAFLLGTFSTALASVLFYKLIRTGGTVFSSMVTYGIPVVAMLWGLFYGENIGPGQVFSLFVILAGVFIANKNITKHLIKE